MPVQKMPNGRWRVQLRRKGLPRFDKVFETEGEARDAESEQLALPKRGFQPVETTLNDLWVKYAASLQFKQKAQNTQRTEATRIKPVLAALGQYALEHLQASPALIYDYIDKRAGTVSPRTGKTISSTSVRLEIAALSSVVIWLVDRRIVTENFIRFIKRPSQAARNRRVSPLELANMAHGESHDKPRVAQASRFSRLLRLLGCRPDELAGLLCRDVDLDTATVTFHNTKHQRESRSVHATKAAKQSISAQIEFINETAEFSPYLFPTRRRVPLGTSPEQVFVKFNYSGAIKTIRKEGIVPEDFCAHANRREFISRAIEDGVPYATIRKQTGHHSSAAIEIYDRGLSTAPEIRAALDQHGEKVSEDELTGVVIRMGLGKAAVEEVLRLVRRTKRVGIKTQYPVPRANEPPASASE